MWGVGVIMYRLVTGARRLKRIVAVATAVSICTSKHTEPPGPINHNTAASVLQGGPSSPQIGERMAGCCWRCAAKSGHLAFLVS
jgi:hypothetical protein